MTPSPSRSDHPTAGDPVPEEISEDRLVTILQATSDFVGTTSRDGRTQWVNRGGRRMLGIPLDADLRGEPISTFHPDWAHEHVVSEGIPTALREGSWRGETTFVTVDGREIPVSQLIIAHRKSDGSVGYLSTIARDVSERNTIEEALRRSEERHRLFFEQNPQPMFVYDTETLEFLAVNEAAVRHYGYAREEFLSMTLRDIRPPEDVPSMLEAVREDSVGLSDPVEARHETKDGDVIDVEVTANDVRYGDRHARLVVAVDVTERTRLERRLRQARKMEAVGHLAGGVAHDFNNLLTAILGYSELVLDDLGDDDAHRAEVEEIRLAADRAASLTDQLLTFSRERLTAPQVLDLNDLVEESLRLLSRIIEEDVTLETDLDSSLGPVESDPAQLHQVIMNLCVNARDAMPHGGRLEIATREVEIGAANPHLPADAEPGPYVELTVSDTGCGMDEETLHHVFEPFFTTKDPGRGTGLGLATVYATVRQSGGHAIVESEPGRGSTFRLFLPRVDGAIPEGHEDEPGEVRGEEAILLVEDESSVRQLARRILASAGYTVREAENGVEGLEVYAAHGEAIDLVVTDIVMPELGGRPLVERLHRERPELPVIYISGYTRESIDDLRDDRSGVAFLSKPFTPNDLTRKVRETLDTR